MSEIHESFYKPTGSWFGFDAISDVKVLFVVQGSNVNIHFDLEKNQLSSDPNAQKTSF